MVEVFSWNEVDGFFTFNFDFILTFSQGHKDLIYFHIILLTGTTLYSAHLIKPLQLNLDHGRNVCRMT